MKKKLPIILGFFILLANSLFAQQEKTTIPPLYRYLQNNADTTVVLTYDKDPIRPTAHYFLSKKAEQITLYLYGSPYDRRIQNEIPRNIRSFFQKRDIEINSLKIDTNSYFNVKYASQKRGQSLWYKTMRFQPWQLADDTVEGYGCGADNRENDVAIYDGGTVNLYLITKDNIKHLYFYAPKFYEDRCKKGRKDRKAIIKLEHLFKTYFE